MWKGIHSGNSMVCYSAEDPGLLLRVQEASKKNSFQIEVLILLANITKSDTTYFDI